MFVHRCQFVEYAPSAVTAIEFLRGSSCAFPPFAVARENGDIEIWFSDATGAFPFVTLPGNGKHSAARSLVWIDRVNYLARAVIQDDDTNSNSDGDSDSSDSSDESMSDGDSDDDTEMDWVKEKVEAEHRENENRKRSRDASGENGHQHPDVRKRAELPQFASSVDGWKSWFGETILLSAGYDGRVVEWDLNTLSQKTFELSHGGAIWSMAVTTPIVPRPRIALGCEDGSVRLFHLDLESSRPLAYASRLPPQPKRVLSVSFNEKGDRLVTGGADSSVRIYDTSNGRCIHHMTCQSFGKNPTVVWAVRYLRDDTIVSGNSLGDLEVWDGHFGVRSQCLRHHKADITCLATNETNDYVVAGGMDARVSVYSRNFITSGVMQSNENDNDGPISEGEWSEWHFVCARRHHSHDLAALSIRPRLNTKVYGYVDEMFLSGGVDCRVVAQPLQTMDNCVPLKMYPYPHRSKHQAVAVGSSRFLLDFSLSDNSLDLWSLGAPPLLHIASSSERRPGEKRKAKRQAGERQPTTVETQSAHKRRLRIKLKESDGNILCAAINDDATSIAVSTTNDFKIFRLTHEDDGFVSPKRALLLFSRSFKHTVMDMRFCSLAQNHTLAMVCNNGSLMAIEIGAGEVMVDTTPPPPSFYASEDRVLPLLRLTMSRNNEWIAVSDVTNRICIYEIDTGKWRFQIPPFSADVPLLLNRETSLNDSTSYSSSITERATVTASLPPSAAFAHPVSVGRRSSPESSATTVARNVSAPITAITTMACHPLRDELVVIYSDNRMYIFDIFGADEAFVRQRKRDASVPLTEWSQLHSSTPLPTFFREKGEKVKGIAFSTQRGEDKVLLYTHTYIQSIDLRAPPFDPNEVQAEPTTKRKRDWRSQQPKRDPLGRTFVSSFSPMVSLVSLRPSAQQQVHEMVAVQRPWSVVVHALPDPVYHHKYRS